MHYPIRQYQYFGLTMDFEQLFDFVIVLFGEYSITLGYHTLLMFCPIQFEPYYFSEYDCSFLYVSSETVFRSLIDIFTYFDLDFLY